MNQLGVFLDAATVNPHELDMSPLKQCLSQWQFHEHTAPTETAERIRKTTVAVANKTLITRADMLQADQLKLICIAATGTNNVDLVAARELNITVCNVPAYATASVVQHVFALLLSLMTHVHEYRQAVAEQRWQRSKNFCFLDFPINELNGKTLGIVGYGELGRGVAEIAQAFGMNILIAARSGTKAVGDRMPLHELLPRVDVLSLHVPLTEQTRGMIGERELALMKPTAILINTARGGIVVESALADALRNQRLGGAGMDVLTTEPPVDGNPLLFSDIPNLMITPHTAWASVEARQRLIQQVAANIQAFLSGKPVNVVG